MKSRMLIGMVLVVFAVSLAFAQTSPAPDSLKAKKAEMSTGKMQDEKMQGEKHAGMATAEVKAKHNEPILDRLKSSKNFSTFASLLKEAGIEDALAGAGPYTVFAPNDDAFNKLPADQLASLKADKSKLADLLKYHIVTGKNISGSELDKMTGQTIKADNGSDLNIGRNAGKIAVNGTPLSGPNFRGSNGMVHGIRTVLMPGVMAPTEAPMAMPMKHGGGHPNGHDGPKPGEPAPTPNPTPQGK